MRVLKYFQLRRDLICLVFNALGSDNDILLFFSLEIACFSLEICSLLYDLKRYEQKVTKIKCKEKDAVISSWDAPTLLQKKSYVFKKFVKKAAVVKRNMTSRGVLGRSPQCLRAL